MTLIQEGITGKRCWMKKELPLAGITTKPKGHKLLGVHPPALATPPKTEQHKPMVWDAGMAS